MDDEAAMPESADYTPWSELNPDEKADRCREYIKRNQGDRQELQRDIQRLRDILRTHSHSSGGEILASPDFYPSYGGSVGCCEDERNPKAYF
jgi:hypothetical protein